MAYEMKPDTGSLFKNTDRKSDKHAHAKGSAVIDGKHYWMDAWTNAKNDGEKYQSIKFKLKDQQPDNAGGYGNQQNAGGFGGTPDDDDLPF